MSFFCRFRSIPPLLYQPLLFLSTITLSINHYSFYQPLLFLSTLSLFINQPSPPPGRGNCWSLYAVVLFLPDYIWLLIDQDFLYAPLGSPWQRAGGSVNLQSKIIVSSLNHLSTITLSINPYTLYQPTPSAPW
jgi:hypothetical protein